MASDTVKSCEVESTRAECQGIQGAGSEADICFPRECCDAADSPGCLADEIRAHPPGRCTGEEATTEACVLPAEEVADSCGVEGVQGVADEDGILCCPRGCGMCGGDGCESIPMSWVAPGETPLSTADNVPASANSGEFCCARLRDEIKTVCGDGGAKSPCLIRREIPEIPARVEAMYHRDLQEVLGGETCVEGVEGILSSISDVCCPTVCGMCGGTGCGLVDISSVTTDATATEYCCSAEKNIASTRNDICGENGVVAPCLMPLPTPAPTEALAPREPVIDTCGVDGVEGVADTSGRLCCPLGCGMCGGDGCGSVDIRYVEETLGALPDNAKASDYCCTKAFSMQTPLCGEGDSTSTPCLIPVASGDACNLEGTEGVADSSGRYCCPSGCGVCREAGCGEVPISLVVTDTQVPENTTSSEYCCELAFRNVTESCGAKGVGIDPPCLIGEEGSIAPGPTMSPTTTPPADAPMPDYVCQNISVTITLEATFDGIYVMDNVNNMDGTLFVRTDGLKLMMYEPTSDGPRRLRHLVDDDCGSWVLGGVLNGTLAESDYPQVKVKDCASHPEDIDPKSNWVIETELNDLSSTETTGAVECVDGLNTPSPSDTLPPPVSPMPPTPSVSPMPATPSASPLPATPSASPMPATPSVSPTMQTIPSVSPTMPATPSPSTNPPALVGGPMPMSPTPRGSNSSDLSLSESIALGAGLGAAVLLAVFGLVRFSKSRNSTTTDTNTAS